MKIKRSGFTLIELVMVIIILGILASMTLPKFVNFKARAFDKSEDAIIGALNTAIKMKFTENITKGSEPDNAWPSNLWPSSPFTLLAQSPPTKGWDGVADGVNWQLYLWDNPYQVWFFYCPHWDGPATGGVGNKGRRYCYRYGTNTYYGNQQGDLWLVYNQGH